MLNVQFIVRASFIWLTWILAGVIAFTSFAANSKGLAVTKVVMTDARHKDDPRVSQVLQVLGEALELTVDEFGPYELEFNTMRIRVQRLVFQVESEGGENIHFGLTSKDLEKRLIPIRIPVRMGLLNYRLLLIHKDSQEKFASVKTLNQLKALKAGSVNHWVTTQVLDSQGFELVTSTTHDGLFRMLESKRSDYTLRGAHEAFREQTGYLSMAPNVIIEPTLALRIVSPYYLFVSPHEPELAMRIEAGLQQLQQSGRLQEIFFDYYKADLKRAGLENRHIIEVPNDLLPEQTPLSDKSLWYWPQSLLEH